jgi:5-methylcytosine-specific restriction endonuclease McrA
MTYTKSDSLRGLKRPEKLTRWQHARKLVNQKGAVSKRYDAARQEFLGRLDAHLCRCVYCRKPAKVWKDERQEWRLEYGFEVHHVVKRSKEPGQREAQGNLVIACWDCHDAQPGHSRHIRVYGRKQEGD